ncbi:hypothetical protein TSAR_004266 [Trichomalopsis sarcophagae]|uniref:Ionotropic glutamate receptor C-terminal domain-containing protein n=1 Tax=Trichomalopsis sarcophagae TaxID=543379 RepID=A0A232FF90_9HYME|nr:hypothetical protein TSAR_004266 [Trichomalopsis sarcophagae]
MLKGSVYGGRGRKIQKNLVIVYHSQNVPNKFLKTAVISLLESYLDPSIKVIEVYNNNVNKITTLHNYESASTVLMHSYDYSTKSYSVTDIFEIQSIFDTKTYLRNQTLTMTLGPSPNINAQLNSDGCYDPETLAGPHGLILKHIAKANNFRWRILRLSKTVEKNEKINNACSVYESLKPLIKQKADIMGNFAHIPYWARIPYYEHLGKIYIRRTEPQMAVIPIFYKNQMYLSSNFLSLFLATIIVVIILKITIRSMKFDSRFWNIETMLYAIVGMGIEVGKAITTSEKMILTCVLLLSVIYSVGIVDQLLDIKMELNQPLQINTLEELEKYKLTLMTLDLNRNFLLNSEDPDVVSFAKNAITTSSYKSDRVCIENLVLKSYKNLTCIQYQSDAEATVKMSILKHGKANVQILKEHVSIQWLIINTRPLFKHTDRFEKVVLYLTEAGLIDRWYKTELIPEPDSHNLYYFSFESKVNVVREVNYTQELKQILAIAIVGYILSCVILLGEIINSRIEPKRKLAALKNEKVFKLRRGNVRKSVTKIVFFFKNFDKRVKAALRKPNRKNNATKISTLFSGNNAK